MPNGKTQETMPMIGVEELWWYELLEDQKAADGKPEYSNGERLPGLVSFGITHNSTVSTFFADNIAYVTAAQLGDMSAAVGCADILPSTLAKWHGFEYKDGLLYKGQIDPIEMCLAYVVTKANGSKRYIRLMKTKPSLSDETVSTKTNTTAFQSGTTNFGVAMLNNDKMIGKKFFNMTLDDDDPTLPQDVTPEVIARNWFADPLWTPADGDIVGEVPEA